MQSCEISMPGPGNFCLVHVSLVPVLNVVGEQVNFLLIWWHKFSSITVQEHIDIVYFIT
jgi:hypothetical protein